MSDWYEPGEAIYEHILQISEEYFRVNLTLAANLQRMASKRYWEYHLRNPFLVTLVRLNVIKVLKSYSKVIDVVTCEKNGFLRSIRHESRAATRRRYYRFRAAVRKFIHYYYYASSIVRNIAFLTNLPVTAFYASNSMLSFLM